MHFIGMEFIIYRDLASSHAFRASGDLYWRCVRKLAEESSMSRVRIVPDQADQPLTDSPQMQSALAQHSEAVLDEALEASFPASDPLASNRFD
ncbi:hypothetical protein [Novosphingobium sp.]|uniref:hypothetical protein n=1 Tax=Novosphingobium sp. TaxID=1874826 RepID=UPI003BAAD225